ncbi:MAG: tetratricopeptide repeat protein [Candidatus Hermodarchaeota archaeon]
MFEQAPKNLENVLETIREGKFNKASQKLRNFEKQKQISMQETAYFHLMRCYLFLTQGLYRDAANLAEQTYIKTIDLEIDFLTVDILLFRAHALLETRENFEKAKELIIQGEEFLKTLVDEPEINRKRREAYIHYLKGMCSDPLRTLTGDANTALMHYKLSLSLRESLGDIYDVCYTLINIAWFVFLQKCEITLALSYVESAMLNLKDTRYKYLICWALLTKASIFHLKGEVSQSIPIYKQSLALSRMFDHKLITSAILNNMAEALRMNGDLEQALEFSKESVRISTEIGDLKRLASKLDFLIQILIERGELEKVQLYFNKLEQLNKKLNGRSINEIYLLNKALLLNKSSRISNHGKAEEILKQILEDEHVKWEIRLRVLLTLSEIFITEVKFTGNIEVLKEVESLISQLFEIAEKSHSYWIWGETFLLQAKMALISLKLNDARRLLTQGQKTAEKYGLNLLARKISNEHDVLLKQLDVWEKLKGSKAPLSERLELARLNNQMKIMIQKRVIEPPEIEDEEPVLLLIVSEGGKPIFSRSFIEDQAFEDHLIGGFLSAFNSFSDEIFSKGLDRASFGEYTLFMNSASPFLVCYLFKGQSYSAQRKLNYFLEKITNDNEIWQNFEKFFKLNQEIQPKDIPSLEPLITEVFINRTVSLNP